MFLTAAKLLEREGNPERRDLKIAGAGLGTQKGARVERTKLEKSAPPGVLVEQGA
jgi:hypothetical protein